MIIRFNYNEFEEAVKFLKSTPDNFYKGFSRYDTLSDRDKSTVLSLANKLWEEKTSTKKEMLLD